VDFQPSAAINTKVLLCYLSLPTKIGVVGGFDDKRTN